MAKRTRFLAIHGGVAVNFDLENATRNIDGARQVSSSVLRWFTDINNRCAAVTEGEQLASVYLTDVGQGDGDKVLGN